MSCCPFDVIQTFTHISFQTEFHVSMCQLNKYVWCLPATERWTTWELIEKCLCKNVQPNKRKFRPVLKFFYNNVAMNWNQVNDHYFISIFFVNFYFLFFKDFLRLTWKWFVCMNMFCCIISLFFRCEAAFAIIISLSLLLFKLCFTGCTIAVFFWINATKRIRFLSGLTFTKWRLFFCALHNIFVSSWTYFWWNYS